jgi:type I restriction enzyme S subunit
MISAKVVRLGDYCRQDRQTIRPGEAINLRYVGLEAIVANAGEFNWYELSKTPEVPAANSFRFDDRHVLYGKLRPYLNKVAIADFEGKCSTEIIPLLPIDALDKRYLAYFLRSAQTVEKISAKTAGARMPRADMDFLFDLQMPLPSIDEQDRLVELLSRAESIVRLRRDAQQKASELVPAIFLEMFGDPRTNPKSLPVYPLGDLMVSPPTLGTMAKPSENKARWLDLRVANIQGGKLTLEDRKWLDLSEREIERFQLVAGDVILARAIGSVDHLGKAVVVYPDGDWTFDSHLMRLRFDPRRMLPEWFVPYLSSEGGRAEFLKHTRHSAVQFNINGKEIRKLEIPLPSLEAQERFCARTEEIRSIAVQQSIANAKAEAVFQSLLYATFNS